MVYNCCMLLSIIDYFQNCFMFWINKVELGQSLWKELDLVISIY